MTCKTCPQCNVTLHESYFGTRTRAGKVQMQGVCKACMRERWRIWNQTKRGGLRGYRRAQRLCGSPWEVAQAIVQYASNLAPDIDGVRVYRKGGEILYWHGHMKAPRDAEFLGLYDFEAEPEMIVEDLETA